LLAQKDLCNGRKCSTHKYLRCVLHSRSGNRDVKPTSLLCRKDNPVAAL